MHQLQMAYPPESVARALQGLVEQRVALEAGTLDEGLGASAAEGVLRHHFGDCFLSTL